MITKITVITFFLFLGLNAFSQVKQLSGYIIDEQTGQAVSEAHLMLADGKTSTTDFLGQFSFMIDKMPVIIRITHVSYGQSDVKIQKWPQETLTIRIQKMITNLEEVQISSERLRILTKKTDFSLQDFAFDAQNLWMIGHVNNQANMGRLFLANQFGDTISSISIRGEKSLYKDAFGNVHLILKDSVYQLDCGDSTSIRFLYPAKKNIFMAIMEPILVGFSEKLVYKNAIQQNEEAFIYYYDEFSDIPKFLTHIVDSIELVRKEFDRIGGSMWLQLKASRYWKKDTKISQIYEGKVPTPMFSLNDSLFIVNCFKDSLLIYDSEGHFVESISVSFHKDSLLGDINYKEIKFLSDEKSGKVYILERKFVGWSISPLNLKTGKVLPTIPLPDFPGMTQITAFNTAIYFLYHEKHYPFYTRLFRFQL